MIDADTDSHECPEKRRDRDRGVICQPGDHVSGGAEHDRKARDRQQIVKTLSEIETQT